MLPYLLHYKSNDLLQLSTIYYNILMEFSTYTTVKSAKQPFPHIHFLVCGDHHILEINDAMARHEIFYVTDFENAVQRDEEFEDFFFQADDEGYHETAETLEANSAPVSSGNVTDTEENYSTFTVKVNNGDNGKRVVIMTTFNRKQVETIFNVDTQEKKDEAVKVVPKITKAIGKGISQWFDECQNSVFEEDERWERIQHELE